MNFEEIKHRLNKSKWYGSEAWQDILNIISDCEDKSLPRRPKGEWTEVEKSEHGGLSIVSMRCNQCRRYAYLVLPKGTKCVYDYCPNCGADMRGENVR